MTVAGLQMSSCQPTDVRQPSTIFNTQLQQSIGAPFRSDKSTHGPGGPSLAFHKLPVRRGQTLQAASADEVWMARLGLDDL